MVELSSNLCRVDILLSTQTRKLLSITPGGKSGLLHIGVNTEVNCDLPSNFLMACHALTVEIVIGLVQADFKDALFLINKRLLKVWTFGHFTFYIQSSQL